MGFSFKKKNSSEIETDKKEEVNFKEVRAKKVKQKKEKSNKKNVVTDNNQDSKKQKRGLFGKSKNPVTIDSIADRVVEKVGLENTIDNLIELSQTTSIAPIFAVPNYMESEPTEYLKSSREEPTYADYEKECENTERINVDEVLQKLKTDDLDGIEAMYARLAVSAEAKDHINNDLSANLETEQSIESLGSNGDEEDESKIKVVYDENILKDKERFDTGIRELQKELKEELIELKEDFKPEDVVSDNEIRDLRFKQVFGNKFIPSSETDNEEHDTVNDEIIEESSIVEEVINEPPLVEGIIEEAPLVNQNINKSDITDSVQENDVDVVIMRLDDVKTSSLESMKGGE